MKRDFVGRIGAWILLGLLFGAYVNRDYVKWHQRGLDAFLASERARFEQSMAHPAPAAVTFVAGMLVVAVFIGVYELTALAITYLVKAVAPEEREGTDRTLGD